MLGRFDSDSLLFCLFLSSPPFVTYCFELSHSLPYSITGSWLATAYHRIGSQEGSNISELLVD